MAVITPISGVRLNLDSKVGGLDTVIADKNHCAKFPCCTFAQFTAGFHSAQRVVTNAVEPFERPVY